MFPGTTYSPPDFFAPRRLPAVSLGPLARPWAACWAERVCVVVKGEARVDGRGKGVDVVDCVRREVRLGRRVEESVDVAVRMDRLSRDCSMLGCGFCVNERVDGERSLGFQVEVIKAMVQTAWISGIF